MQNFKKNIFYSVILNCSNYVFPLITFPYLSRVLGVSNIGVCNFIDSIINYFILFSMMGMTTIGIREIAASKNDKKLMSETFSNLIVLNGLATILVLIILLFSIFLIPELNQYKNLMFIGCIKLISNLFLIEWFFKGIENFKYITNRTILVKCMYVVSIFIFVKDKDDYFIYYLLSTFFLFTISAIININYSKRFVDFNISNTHPFIFLKPFLLLGVYLLLTSMYTSFNTAYLGFIGGPTEVGYYSTATKLFGVGIALYSAFTSVMMPRLSSILAEGDNVEFNNKINLSNELLLAFAIPVSILFTIFAPEIIYVMSGKGFEGAVVPMRIIMPLIFIIGYEQILVIQMLMPLRKDKIILYNSIAGASVGIILNIALVPYLNSIGSSIVWVCSELCVLIFAQYFTQKYTGIGFPFRLLTKYVLLSIFPTLLLVMTKLLCQNLIIYITVFLFYCVYYLIIYLFVIRMDFLRKMFGLNYNKS